MLKMIQIDLDTVDSTQEYAKRIYPSLAQDQITCITAEEQTEGHGRYQRPWISPRGVNIYATFCFQLERREDLIYLAQLMALSCATVLLAEGFHPKIKWPNDIQLQGKKVSGILCETLFLSNNVQIFLGIGINVNMEAEALAQIDQPVTSLKIESKKSWDRKFFLKKLQTQFEKDLALFKKEGFIPFHNKLEQFLNLTN